MTEKAMMVGMIVFYVILIGICLFSLYQIYKMLMAIVYELIDDAYEEGKYEEKTEEIMRSGETARGTVLSGSNERDAEKEESGEWQKKKS